jgi:hypothetical protein
MIFDGTKIKQYDSKRGLDMITYPVGGDDSKALAFMKVISKDALKANSSFDMSLIFVGILENPPVAPLSDEIEERFLGILDMIDLENATSAQKRGLEPIAENIFSSEDPVSAYNRFQDLIYEYEQKKKEEKDDEAVALVVKKSEDFKNIYPYTSKNGIGPLFDKFTELAFHALTPKTYFFGGNTEKMVPKPEGVAGLFVMTDEDDDIFYFIPISKSKGEDQNGDSGQGDPDGDGEPNGDGKPGKGKPGKGKPGKGEPGDPGKGEPGGGEPGGGEPGGGEPGIPGKGEPGGGEPGGGEPGGGEPGGGEPGIPGKGELGGKEPGGGEPDGGEPGKGKPGKGKPGDPGEAGDGKSNDGGQRGPKDDDFDQEILRISESIGVRPAQVAASFTSEIRARSLLSGGNFEKLNESRTMSDYIGYVRSIM